MNHVEFRIQPECVLDALCIQCLERFNLEIRRYNIICKHVRLLSGFPRALRREQSSHALKRCCLLAEWLGAHIELASIKFHALKVNSPHSFDIVEIAIQQLNDVCRRAASLTSCNSCTLHEIKDCLPPYSIAHCKLIELKCELILAQLLSGHASTCHSFGSIQLDLLHLAIHTVAKRQIGEGIRQPRNALCHHEGFSALSHPELFRIKHDIRKAHLSIDFTLCRFQDASCCQTAQWAADSSRQCGAESHVPGKILDSVVVKDWRVIHGCKDAKLKGSTKHCLIRRFPCELTKTIARQNRLDCTATFCSVLQCLAEVFILAGGSEI